VLVSSSRIPGELTSTLADIDTIHFEIQRGDRLRQYQDYAWQLEQAHFSSGQEEGLLRQITQAAKGQPGIFVLTQEVVQDPVGLEELVKRLPPALLERIIWFNTGAALAERLRTLEPTLRIIKGNDTQALVLALLSDSRAEQITTTSQALTLYLQQTLPMTVTYLKALTVKLILAALGVPVEQLEAIDPTKLEALFAPLIAA